MLKLKKFGIKALLINCLAVIIVLIAHYGDSKAGGILASEERSCCEILKPEKSVYDDSVVADSSFYQQTLQGVVEGRSGFWQALMGGDFDFNNRFRTEFVQMDGLRSARAITNRFQLGYGTLPFYGFAAYADFVDTRPIGREGFNAAGLNNREDRAVVADPRLTVLNQLYGQFTFEPYEVLLRVGRQRIIHNDARFVGNVGWRQNEQTFDAITANTSLGLEHLKLQYNYIWQANRVLGPDHPFGIFKSRSHLVHATYRNILAGGDLTGFIYLLDFETNPIYSSNTIGFRLDGGFTLIDDYKINYIGSLSRQADAGDNPVNYSTSYFLFDLNLEHEIWGRAGGAFEVLGSDDGIFGFQTPLATLHGFQGWADVFLTTPTSGIEDISVYASSMLPGDVGFTIRYHWFYQNEGNNKLGEELNFSLRKQVNDFWGIMVKFADFNGRSGFVDRRKFWIQTEIQF